MAYGRHKLTDYSGGGLTVVSHNNSVPASGTATSVNLFEFTNSNSKSLGFWDTVHSRWRMIFSPGIATSPPTNGLADGMVTNHCFYDDPIVGWMLYLHDGTGWESIYLYDGTGIVP